MARSEWEFFFWFFRLYSLTHGKVGMVIPFFFQNILLFDPWLNRNGNSVVVVLKKLYCLING